MNRIKGCMNICMKGWKWPAALKSFECSLRIVLCKYQESCACIWIWLHFFFYLPIMQVIEELTRHKKWHPCLINNYCVTTGNISHYCTRDVTWLMTCVTFQLHYCLTHYSLDWHYSSICLIEILKFYLQNVSRVLSVLGLYFSLVFPLSCFFSLMDPLSFPPSVCGSISLLHCFQSTYYIPCLTTP